MRVLTSSVLVMEAIMLGLAIPVVLKAGGQPGHVGWILAGLALVALLLPALVKRPVFVPAGWTLQALVIACGIAFEGMLVILGVVFGALWWAALHFGRKAEAFQASAATDPS